LEGKYQNESERKNGTIWTAFVWARVGTLADCYEYDNEPSTSEKGRKLISN
jgi:hypothetical protein